MRQICNGFIIFVSVLSAGCASQNVNTDYDKSYNFKSLKSFAWLKSPQEDLKAMPKVSELNHKRIREAIERTLINRGYTKSVGNSKDFYVNYHTSLTRRIDPSPVNAYYGVGRHFGRGSVGITFGGPIASHSEYEEETLIIDIVSGRDKKLVWRGDSSHQIDRSQTPEQRTKEVNEVVAEILSAYPPK